jgi:hypothetical protein
MSEPSRREMILARLALLKPSGPAFQAEIGQLLVTRPRRGGTSYAPFGS